jgi:hypothetical protein
LTKSESGNYLFGIYKEEKPFIANPMKYIKNIKEVL